MNLTREEQQMVESMRVANKSKAVGNRSNNHGVQMNLLSSLETLITQVATSQSLPSEYVSTAREMQSKIQEAGGLHNLGLNKVQVNQLLQMGEEVVTYADDASLNNTWTTVAQTAQDYREGKTDIDLAQETKRELTDDRSSNRPTTWDTVINPITGNKAQVNSSTGEIRNYQDSEADVEDAMAESDAGFLEHIQGGGSPESYGQMQDLVEV